MKKFFYNLILGGLFIAMTFAISSCSKDSPVLNDQLPEPQVNLNALETQALISNDVSLKKEILHFKNLEGFRNTLIALNRMPDDIRLQWEQNLGFSSAQTIFNQIILAEFEEIEQDHSDLYHQKMESGMIILDDHARLYKPNLFNTAYAPVLNEDGLAMIGNTLYQFTSNSLKIWKDADLDQVELILNATENSDQIRIIPIEQKQVALRSETTNWADNCLSEENGEELHLAVTFSSSSPAIDVSNILFVDYAVELKILIPDDNGNLEYDPNAKFSLSGRSITYFTISDGVEESVKSVAETCKISGNGGNYTYLPQAAGEIVVDSPYYFSDLACLGLSNWSVVAASSTQTYHECTVAL